jgi:glutamate N-acetyltransferase / amino-acid N-acetyltransferase
VDGVEIVQQGVGAGVLREKEAAERMKNPEFTVTVDLGLGSSEDCVLTCDLTHEYVSINAHYRT